MIDVLIMADNGQHLLTSVLCVSHKHEVFANRESGL